MEDEEEAILQNQASTCGLPKQGFSLEESSNQLRDLLGQRHPQFAARGRVVLSHSTKL